MVLTIYGLTPDAFNFNNANLMDLKETAFLGKETDWPYIQTDQPLVSQALDKF